MKYPEALPNLYTPSQILTKEDFDYWLKRFRAAWCLETCYPPFKDKWSPDRPSTGQCGVTALVVARLFGGDILYDRANEHCFNRLPDDSKQDFARDQFDVGVVIIPDRIFTPAEEFITEEIVGRLDLLNKRLGLSSLI